MNILSCARTLRSCILFLMLTCTLPALAAEKYAIADSLIRAASLAKSDTERATVLLHISKLYKPDSVVKQFYYANEALLLSKRAGWLKGEMYAEELIGECYATLTVWEDAILHFIRSIHFARKIGRQDMERVGLQYLVHCYDHSGNQVQATACQKKLLELTAKAGDLLEECNQMSAYAQCLQRLGKHSEAISYMWKDIRLVESRFTGNVRTEKVADLLNTLATIYVHAEKSDSAISCLRYAERLTDKIDNPVLLAYINSSFCDAFIEAQDYDSAIFYGERTIVQAEAISDLALQQRYNEVLSPLYERLHRPVEALRSHRRSDSLMNIINNPQNRIDQALAVTRVYMEQQAEMNKAEKTAFETIRRTQQSALAGTLAAIATLVALIVLVYRNLREKQRANTTIARQALSLREQNEIIENALMEKDVLLQETHHRIKNNLQLITSLLELQTAEITDANARSALRTAQRRVLSIASVHSKLYVGGDDTGTDLHTYANDLFASLSGAFGSEGRNVAFENNIPPVSFGLNTLVPLGLILNELITNSFKYAFDNTSGAKIGITLSLPGDAYILQYYDSGAGIREDKLSVNSSSMGLNLIRRLSKQLKGSATYSYDRGSIFTIIFQDAGN